MTITPLAPTRTLSFAQGVGSFFLDTANDRLYVAQLNGVVLVFDNASLLPTGTPPPNRTIDLFSGAQSYIFVDTSRNKLYAVANIPGGTTSALIIVDNASVSNDTGPVVPDGIGVTITAPNIRLSAVAVAP